MSIEFNNYFQAAPKVRPMLNMGCLMDIPTGRYMIGKRGESILNGGLAYITGIGGKGNTFKSVLGSFFMLMALNRYRSARATEYDTETSATLARLMMLSVNMPNIAGVDLEAEGRLYLSDNTVMSGDEYFASLRKLGQDKVAARKQLARTLPFADESGKPIVAMEPTVAFVDSFSMFTTAQVDAIYEKNKLGEAGANTDALRSAAHKNQMLMQLPTLTGQANLYTIMTAHVGKQHQLDPYAPPDRKLAFLKNNSFKNVPEKFSFLTNNLWYVFQTQVLSNRGTKAPEYPRDSNDNLPGDTDLQSITVQNLRGKSGPTGLPFEIVLSQRDGVLVGLTEFHYLKSFDRFGISGNDRNYALDLLPEVSLSRTTVRGKIDADERLQRALTITSELCQMRHLWEDEDGLFCTPKELYEDIKKLGYDWDELLGKTRGHWVFEEDEPLEEKHFLSTMDLLRIRKGLYHPFWMKDNPTKK